MMNNISSDLLLHESIELNAQSVVCSKGYMVFSTSVEVRLGIRGSVSVVFPLPVFLENRAKDLSDFLHEVRH